MLFIWKQNYSQSPPAMGGYKGGGVVAPPPGALREGPGRSWALLSYIIIKVAQKKNTFEMHKNQVKS